MGIKRLTQLINQLSCRFGRHVRTWSWWWQSCWRSRAWSLPWTGCWHCTSACAHATMHAGGRRGNASVVYVDDDTTLTTTQSSARLFRSSWPDTDRSYSSHTVNCGIVFLHTHTHPFNGPLSGTTQVSQYQKGKTNLYFTEARDSGWQWHQLGHNASLHLAPDRQPHQHPTTLMFLQARCPSCRPTNSVKALKAKPTIHTSFIHPAFYSPVLAVAVFCSVW